MRNINLNVAYTSVWAIVNVGLLSAWAYISVSFYQCGLLSAWAFIIVRFRRFEHLARRQLSLEIFSETGESGK